MSAPIQIVTMTADEFRHYLDEAAERAVRLALARMTAIEKPAPPAEWLTVNEAAKALGVKPRTVHLWAKQGRIVKYRDTAGNPRFKRVEVEKMFGRTKS
jgi:excisionase family DNA binding protein